MAIFGSETLEPIELKSGIIEYVLYFMTYLGCLYFVSGDYAS